MKDFFTKGRITKYTDGTISIDTVDTVYMRPRNFKIHTVREGDTLQSIAFYHYKNSKEWEKIARANDFIDPFTLTIGSNLIIPKL